jgi:hypothetical protein
MYSQVAQKLKKIDVKKNPFQIITKKWNKIKKYFPNPNSSSPYKIETNMSYST